MIKEIFEEMPVISSMVALALFALVFFLSDGLLSKPEYHQGNVIDKHYSAESHKTGTGVGMTSGGQTGVIITSESEPEKFLLIIKANDGKIKTAKCSPELYYGKKTGQSIEFAIYKGLFTGMEWAIKGVR